MSTPALMTPGQTVQYLPDLIVDGKGTAHCAYIVRVNEAVIWYTKNSAPKNLNGWTSPLALTAGTGLDWSFPKIAADNEGNAYVVWQEEHAGNEEVYLKYQVNGVWQATVTISNTAAPSEFPSVAVNPVTKEIFVSWVELTGGGWVTSI